MSGHIMQPGDDGLNIDGIPSQHGAAYDEAYLQEVWDAISIIESHGIMASLEEYGSCVTLDALIEATVYMQKLIDSELAEEGESE